MTQIEKLRHITPREFAILGMQDMAYVKRITVNDGVGFAIHAADGTQVAVLNDQDIAIATVRQHDLEALSVH